MLVPLRGVTTWRLHIQKLYKFRLNISPNTSRVKNCTDPKLIESLCILKVFHFPDSGLNLLNGFGFYFRWRDSEKQLYVLLVQKANMTF